MGMEDAIRVSISIMRPRNKATDAEMHHSRFRRLKRQVMQWSGTSLGFRVLGGAAKTIGYNWNYYSLKEDIVVIYGYKKN